MTSRSRTRSSVHFPRPDGAPAPLAATVQHRVQFRECDPMAVVWHGAYPALLEEAAAELRRMCGLSYAAFHEAGLFAPIVELHVNYFHPLRLDEVCEVRARMVWSEAARLDVEYEIDRADGVRVATAHTVQLFVDAGDGGICPACPPLLERCRERWKRGAFNNLQSTP